MTLAYWAQWSSWEQCSKSCGTGTRTASKTCIYGEPGNAGCEGKPERNEICNNKRCRKFT